MEVIKFTTVISGALQGIFDVKMPEWDNFILKGLKLFKKGENRWVNLPDQRAVIKDQETWIPVCNFVDKSDKYKFLNRALKAVDKYAQNNSEKLYKELKDKKESNTEPAQIPISEAISHTYTKGTDDTTEPNEELPF